MDWMPSWEFPARRMTALEMSSLGAEELGSAVADALIRAGRVGF